MLRNILRTSRLLARKQINTRASFQVPSYSYTKILRSQGSLIVNRKLSSQTQNPGSTELDPAVFEDICCETLESLCDYFEEIVEATPNLDGADITFSDGVLTVNLGKKYGTYVINRQTPNKQIWLSSPVSGPKRYDLVLQNGGYWIYKHDGVTLHRLLQSELSEMLDTKVNFENCTHSVL